MQDFEAFLNKHKDEIIALKIYYNEPHRRKNVTYGMIKKVYNKLKQSQPNIALARVFEAYANLENKKLKPPISELTALVALIRKICGIDSKLTLYSKTVHLNFQKWMFKKHESGSQKFTEEQMK